MHSTPDPVHVRFTGPLMQFVSGLAEELALLGYTATSATAQMQLAAHLSRWLESQSMGLGTLTGPAIERFLAQRRANYTNHYSVQALGPVLGYLRRQGVVPTTVEPAPTSPAEVLLARYRDYLIDVRNLSGPVARAYSHWVRPFVVDRTNTEGQVGLAELTARDVAQFLTAYLPRMTRKTAQMTACALRSFLRFAHDQQLIQVALADAVPAVANRRLSGLPQALTPAEVDDLLLACDRSSPVGRRDFAVITVLHRLGLRCAELNALRLDEVDWHSGTLTVHGKGNQTDLLPLPVDVGQAMGLPARRATPNHGPEPVRDGTSTPHRLGDLKCQLHRGPGRRACRVGHGPCAPFASHHGEPHPQRRGEPGRSRAPAASRQPGHDHDLRQDQPDQTGDVDAAMARRAHRADPRRPVMSTGREELEQLVADYLTVRRSLGYKLIDAEYILDRFVAYLHDHGVHGVTVLDALGFATAPPVRSPRTQALRLSAIRCFTRWAHCQDPDIEVPPARLLPARPTRVAPYIYTAEEIQALLDAAGLLRPELRAATYRTLIGLMAATGIRTGEVVALDIASLDQVCQTLTVRGKYDKIRLLPLHPSVVEALTGYLQQRDRLLPAAACPALLISTKGTRLRPSNVHPTFRGLADQAGLKPASSSCRPRLHDFRH
ncbi:MAG: tyrosine-type recombinase/integrase [Nocardioides sp.]